MKVKNLIIVPLLVASVFLVFGCKSKQKSTHSTTVNVSKTKFKFEKSRTLSTVLDQAAEKNRPVFVDFYTSWCTPCKMMDEDVFTDRQLAKYYNEKFMNYKVDCETQNGANLASIFNVSTYPTLLWLDTKGNVLVKYEGAAYHSKMYQLGDEALRAFSNKTAAL